MTKYAVFGAGLMGRVIAADLLDSEPDAAVNVFDISELLLQETKGYVRSDRFQGRVVDVTDASATVTALRGHSAAICALPHGLSLPLIDSAIEAGVSLVDLVGEAPEQRAAAMNGRDGRAASSFPGAASPPASATSASAEGSSFSTIPRTRSSMSGGYRRGRSRRSSTRPSIVWKASSMPISEKRRSWRTESRSSSNRSAVWRR
jgi:hypothetical protein